MPEPVCVPVPERILYALPSFKKILSRGNWLEKIGYARGHGLGHEKKLFIHELNSKAGSLMLLGKE